MLFIWENVSSRNRILFFVVINAQNALFDVFVATGIQKLNEKTNAGKKRHSQQQAIKFTLIIKRNEYEQVLRGDLSYTLVDKTESFERDTLGMLVNDGKQNIKQNVPAKYD